MLTLALLAVILLLAIGAPIFAVMIAATLVGVASLSRGVFVEFGGPIAEIFRLGTGAQAAILSTIPLFIFAGYLMAESRTADRVVRFAQALLGWLPGGLAIVTIFACAIFTVFTGASGVTIVALGGLLMPALIKQGYPQRFSLGLVGGTGSVGLLFPPALPLFIYGTVYGMAAQTVTDTGQGEMKLIAFSTDRFLVAGVVPGLVLCGMLCAYAVAVALAREVPRQKFELRELCSSLFAALPEISIPFFIVATLLSGLFTISEAAALTALYVLVIEAFLYRDLAIGSLWRITREAMALVGGIFIIILCASALTNYFVTAGVPDLLVAWMTSHIESKWAFLLALNLLLFVVGMLMDIFSAIVVVVPLITPTAIRYGIDPYHLGVVFLLNLELGYLTPPVGLNLFIASFKFEQPIVAVVRATLPFLLAMVMALVLVTYVPALTVVPPPRRTGQVTTLVRTVETERAKLSMVSAITLPDGTTVTLASCDALEVEIDKLSCQGLFTAYGACTDDACRAKAVADYAADAGDGGDGGWGDDPWGDDTDAGPGGADDQPTP
jgi:tripartite ATP-independent transporter DctM subunit